MAKKPEFSEDGYRLAISWPNPKGKAPIVRTYLDRRMGIAWPTAHSPGYLCIVGLLDDPMVTDVWPEVLLWEFEQADADARQKLYRQIAVASKQYRCTVCFADLSDEFETYVWALDKFLRTRNARYVVLEDASDFASIEKARASADEKHRNQALRITPRSLLMRQLQILTADDMRTIDYQTPEQRFHRVYAWAMATCSFDLYPFEKPSRPEDDTGSRPGYG